MNPFPKLPATLISSPRYSYFINILSLPLIASRPHSLCESYLYIYLFSLKYFINYLHILAKQPPSAGIPSPSGEAVPPLGAVGAPSGETAAFGGGERRIEGEKKNWGAMGATNGFKNLTCAMRIPNMCLVLKLDNMKVVSIADKQTESQSHPVAY